MLILKLGSLQYFGNILLKKLSNIKTNGILQNYIEKAIKNLESRIHSAPCIIHHKIVALQCALFFSWWGSWKTLQVPLQVPSKFTTKFTTKFPPSSPPSSPPCSPVLVWIWAKQKWVRETEREPERERARETETNSLNRTSLWLGRLKILFI